MSPPPLTQEEIRNFMIANGGKVTNHDLVKYFKETLTDPQSQHEARKKFKTFVNQLATIKAEDNGNGKVEKFLILKQRYANDLPGPDDSIGALMNTSSVNTSMRSLNDSESMGTPSRLPPPPYRAPPEVSTPPIKAIKLPQLEQETETRFRDCVDEFQATVTAIRQQAGGFETPPPTPIQRSVSQESDPAPAIPPRKRSNPSLDQMVTPPTEIGLSSSGRPAPMYEPDSVSMYDTGTMRSITGEMVVQEMYELAKSESESKMSVKEATKKFNRIASEEEKTATPSPKRLEKKTLVDSSPDGSNVDVDNLMSHPKAREWIVSAARANYQELSKLANDYPVLVRLQDPTNGFTALHWAAKHGNENVVKLIAGTHKADVNARTNGGYTPLHIAMQFGKDNIFELLQNVYNANRDLMDWSGKKPLDYRKPKTTVSASTYSSEYTDNMHAPSMTSSRPQSMHEKGHGRDASSFLHALTYPRRRGTTSSLGHQHSVESVVAQDDRQRREERRRGRASTTTVFVQVPGQQREPDENSLSSTDKSESGKTLSRRGRNQQSFLRKKFGSMSKKKRSSYI